MDATADSAPAATTAGDKTPNRRRRRPLWASTLGVVGELLITAGVLVLLLVVYELYITGIYTRAEQHKLKKQIEATFTPPPAVPSTGIPPVETEPAVGQPVAIMYAKALGDTWKWAVVEGVDADQLAKGPGHYPKTAMPGGVGNFVVSGHRTTHGAPFFHADSFKPGDAIVVETAQAWYVYKVTSSSVVSPHQVSVILPVPDQPGVDPTQKLITLTTCNPRYSASQRMIIHGELSETDPKTGPAPVALTTGVA